MDDFFSNLARQVLGSQPEVGPLLPPRFVAWSDLSLASPLAPAPEPVDEPATAEAALFPPPLIAPGHPAVDTPLPTFRQLSQVGTGPGPSIQPELPPMPEETPETAGAEPGDIQQHAAPPVVPAADGSLPDPAKAMPPADVGRTSQPLPAPPAQPVVEEEYSDAAEAEPGEPGHIADRPVTPFVPEPTLEPATAPEPAPVLQRQAGPAAKAAAPPSPAPASRQTPPIAGQGRTPAPPASVGDQTTAAPEGPHSGVGFSPGHDRPTINRRADTAKGDQAPSISLLQQASPYQPDDSSPGQAGPTENPPLSAEGRPAAARDPAAAVQESRTADAALRPLAHEPAPAPPAPPGPAPVLQRQAGPAAKAAAPPSPASIGDQTTAAPEGPLSGLGFSPGHDRPTLKRRADTAKGAQAPSISPIERASPYQLGDSSPSQAGPAESLPLSAEGRPAAARDPAAAVQESRRADTPLRPLVQSAPPGPEPVIQRQVAPGADLPPAAVTLSAAPPSAMAEAASVDQRPPGRIGHEAPDDGHGLPGPAEPSIVPTPEALPAGWRSASRAGERVFSRREPAPGWTGMREPPPTVRVTIGRVEVRMAPPEPPPPVQPRQPLRLALSLDEYLKGGEP